jgi:amidase
MVKVIAVNTAWDLQTWCERTGKVIGEDDVEPLSWELVQRGRAITGPEYLSAINGLHAYTRELAGWWETGFDLLLTPTITEPPPPLGSFPTSKENPLEGFVRSAGFVAFTAPFNISGQPAISLPLHQSRAGLPIGVQLAAAYGREDQLLQVAAQLEQACAWAERRPPIHA